MALKKYGSIQHIYKTQADLTADNTTLWLPGQMIIAVQTNGRLGVKVGDGTKIYSALPWLINPEIDPLTEPPFKVRNTDPEYAEVGDDVVITNDRLIGKEDYLVKDTYLNVEFRDEDLVYDAAAGTVTILDYALPDDQHITIIPNWTTYAAGGLSADIAALQVLSRPFMLGGGMIPFNKPAAEIPDGWQEVTDFRGKTIIGLDVSQIEFDTIGKEGGAKSKTISVDNLPPITFDYDGVDPTIGYKRGTTGSALLSPTAENRTGTIVNANEPLEVLDPYRIVLFIELIP